MRNIGLKACALCIALVFVGVYSGIAGAATLNVKNERLRFRLSVDQLRVCLNSDNPGYLDVIGHHLLHGYPGLPDYKGPDSPRMKAFLAKHKYELYDPLLARDMEKRLSQARITRSDFSDIVNFLDKHTSKTKYEVDLNALKSTRLNLIDNYFRGTRVEEKDKIAYRSYEAEVEQKDISNVSEEHLQKRELEINYIMLGQMIRALTHRCKTQFFDY